MRSRSPRRGGEPIACHQRFLSKVDEHVKRCKEHQEYCEGFNAEVTESTCARNFLKNSAKSCCVVESRLLPVSVSFQVKNIVREHNAQMEKKNKEIEVLVQMVDQKNKDLAKLHNDCIGLVGEVDQKNKDLAKLQDSRVSARATMPRERSRSPRQSVALRKVDLILIEQHLAQVEKKLDCISPEDVDLLRKSVSFDPSTSFTLEDSKKCILESVKKSLICMASLGV